MRDRIIKILEKNGEDLPLHWMPGLADEILRLSPDIAQQLIEEWSNLPGLPKFERGVAKVIIMWLDKKEQ